MKRIVSREKQEKKKNTTKFVGGVLLIALLILSSLGYAFYSAGSSSSNQEDVGNDIEQGSFVNGGWYYSILGNDHLFKTYLPLAQKSEVTLEKKLNELSGTVYVDAGDLEFEEIRNNLGIYIPRIGRGCLGSCALDYPEKTCSDSENLIVFVESGEEKVYEEENCIFIEGSIVSVDAFLYKILGLY